MSNLTASVEPTDEANAKKRSPGKRTRERALAPAPRKFGEIFGNHSRYLSDKWAQFLPVYDSELGPMVARGQPLRLLEIGVQNGGSLQVWHEYLPKGSLIYGIDIDERCRRLVFPPEIKVLIGDAGSPAFLNALLGDEIFDIIIDDGSHQADDVTSAFEALLPRLAPAGKYFIEDLHASYWASHGGGLRRHGTAIEHLKKLVDALHADHFEGDVKEDERQWARNLNSAIERVSFHDSIAVIVKYSQRKTSRFNRVLSGSEMPVTGPGYLLDWIASDSGAYALLNGAKDTVVAAAARELSEMRRERSHKRMELEQRAATEAALRADIEQRAATEAALQADIKQRAAAEATLRADIEQRAAAEATLRADIEQRAAAEATLRADIEQRAATEVTLRAEIEQRAATEVTLQAQLANGVDAEAALRFALGEAELKLETLAATMEAGEAELANIRDALNISERRSQEHLAATEASEAEHDRLRAELAKAEQRYSEREDACVALRGEIASLHNQLAAARDIGRAALLSLKAEAPVAPEAPRNVVWLTSVFRLLGLRTRVFADAKIP
jgi:hypothetical protein